MSYQCTAHLSMYLNCRGVPQDLHSDTQERMWEKGSGGGTGTGQWKLGGWMDVQMVDEYVRFVLSEKKTF